MPQAIREVAQNEYTIGKRFGDVFHEPFKTSKDCRTARLTQRYHDNSSVFGMKERHGMIEITIG